MGGAIGILAIGVAVWALIALFTAKSEGARRIKWVVVGLFVLGLGAIVVSIGGFGALAVVLLGLAVLAWIVLGFVKKS